MPWFKTEYIIEVLKFLSSLAPLTLICINLLEFVKRDTFTALSSQNANKRLKTFSMENGNKIISTMAKIQRSMGYLGQVTKVFGHFSNMLTSRFLIDSFLPCEQRSLRSS